MIPEIKLVGSSQAMGLQLGNHFRNKIQELAQKRLAILNRFAYEYCHHKISETKLLEIIRNLLPCHEAYDKELWNEFCGIAKGAQISVEMLLIAMGYTDLRDYVASRLQALPQQNFDSVENVQQ